MVASCLCRRAGPPARLPPAAGPFAAFETVGWTGAAPQAGPGRSCPACPGWVGGAQQRRLRCAALRRQAHRHAESDGRLSSQRQRRRTYVKPSTFDTEETDTKNGFDFAAMPPEINSALMYSGAGAGPLMAAATAWNNLAAELSTTATQWESIIATLTTEQWTGAGSAAAAAAAQPYVEWLTTTGGGGRAGGRPGLGVGGRLRGGLYGDGAAAGDRRQQGSAGGAGRDELPGHQHAGDHGHRGPVRRDVGPRRHHDVRATRQLRRPPGSLQPLTPLSPATNPARPGLQAASVARPRTPLPRRRPGADEPPVVGPRRRHPGSGILTGCEPHLQPRLTALRLRHPARLQRPSTAQ